MYIKKLNEKAVIPSRGSKGAAGYDLYTTETYELKVGERKAFKTDISMAIPSGFYGRVAPRSGLAVKKGIDVLAGVIDEDYRGEILVALINLGQEPVQINTGDKIAQIIFENYTAFTLEETTDELQSTERGGGGFGSTDAIPAKTQSLVPPVVQSILTDLYNKQHAEEVVPKAKYSDLIKEREKNI
jgi:dUTP pyrophosphatase